MMTPSQPLPLPILPPASSPGPTARSPRHTGAREPAPDLPEVPRSATPQGSARALLRASRDRAARRALATSPDHRPAVVVLPGDAHDAPMVTHSIDGTPLDEWVIDNLRMAHQFGREFGQRYPGLRVPAAKIAARFLDCVHVVTGDAPLAEFPLDGFMSNLCDFAAQPALDLARGTILGEFFRWLHEHDKISERTAATLLERLGGLDPLVLVSVPV